MSIFLKVDSLLVKRSLEFFLKGFVVSDEDASRTIITDDFEYLQFGKKVIIIGSDALKAPFSRAELYKALYTFNVFGNAKEDDVFNVRDDKRDSNIIDIYDKNLDSDNNKYNVKQKDDKYPSFENGVKVQDNSSEPFGYNKNSKRVDDTGDDITDKGYSRLLNEGEKYPDFVDNRFKDDALHIKSLNANITKLDGTTSSECIGENGEQTNSIEDIIKNSKEHIKQVKKSIDEDSDVINSEVMDTIKNNFVKNIESAFDNLKNDLKRYSNEDRRERNRDND